MNKSAYWLLFLLAAGVAPNGLAQGVWSYQLVGPDNVAKVYLRPPVDLTYPLPGAPMPVVPVSNNDQGMQGVPLNQREEAARLNAPQLIIDIVPPQTAQHILSGSFF